MNLYEHTWLYDLVYDKPADSEQIAFYERCLRRYGSPVLELAGGCGNDFITFAENGAEFSPSGFDGVKAFSGKNNGNNPGETKHFEGDMRSFDLEDKFALIFAARNSFQHLLTPEDIESTFDSVRRHLKPVGKFVVEVGNPSLESLLRDPCERYFVGEYQTEFGALIVSENVRYDNATQINKIDRHYRHQLNSEEKTVSFFMRQFFPQELDSLFRRNGFRVDRKFGDFDESEFSSLSPKQIIVAALA
jgi:SAM-dependent methyltransferase